MIAARTHGPLSRGPPAPLRFGYLHHESRFTKTSTILKQFTVIIVTITTNAVNRFPCLHANDAHKRPSIRRAKCNA
jgi:hypothetical protein